MNQYCVINICHIIHKNTLNTYIKVCRWLGLIYLIQIHLILIQIKYSMFYKTLFITIRYLSVVNSQCNIFYCYYCRLCYLWCSSRSASWVLRWGVYPERKPWAWWRSWMPSLKCLRATWRRLPQEEQVTPQRSPGRSLWQRMNPVRLSTVSLLAFGGMALLAVLEFFVYRDTWMKYEYAVDKDFSRWVIRLACYSYKAHDRIICFIFHSKLRINVDITVAMKCQRKYPGPPRSKSVAVEWFL